MVILPQTIQITKNAILVLVMPAYCTFIKGLRFYTFKGLQTCAFVRDCVSIGDCAKQRENAVYGNGLVVPVSYPEQRVLHILDMLGFHTYYDYA